jgi:hypothetical protein
MSFLRLPVLLAGLALGAPAAPALAQSTTDTGSGGAVAQPREQGPGGGSLAPSVADPPEPAPVEVPPYVNLEPPTAMSSQASPDAVEPSAAPGDAGSGASAPAAEPARQRAAASQADSGGDAVGSLPFTGLELVALAGIGLCLLTAGIALRPRRTAPS